jgi:hypothetical protein
MMGLYVLLGGLLFVVSMIGFLDWLGRRRNRSQHRTAR